MNLHISANHRKWFAGKNFCAKQRVTICVTKEYLTSISLSENAKSSSSRQDSPKFYGIRERLLCQRVNCDFRRSPLRKKQEISTEIYPWWISPYTVTIELSSFRASRKLKRSADDDFTCWRRYYVEQMYRIINGTRMTTERVS